MRVKLLCNVISFFLLLFFFLTLARPLLATRWVCQEIFRCTFSVWPLIDRTLFFEPFRMNEQQQQQQPNPRKEKKEMKRRKRRESLAALKLKLQLIILGENGWGASAHQQHQRSRCHKQNVRCTKSNGRRSLQEQLIKNVFAFFFSFTYFGQAKIEYSCTSRAAYARRVPRALFEWNLKWCEFSGRLAVRSEND